MNPVMKEIFSWIKVFVIVGLVVILLRMFVMGNYEVHGESMQPSFEDGERVIIDKLSFHFRDPDRFETVVFELDDGRELIKRVIGLPGDRIEFVDDELYVNGEAVEEPYLETDEDGINTSTGTMNTEQIPDGAADVPEGHYFTLGDHRGNSLDSRNLGFIPRDQVVGGAALRYWPIGEFTWISDP
ncbi:signal peptidase I [Salsuginibacillus halophilus]|uniref:Signal peptidase I n=1 Tax=Salsuginibacillus halophilus TaxID=517424 RepID=A0A2P8H3S6_9BACI|nr:signal peptidase I [Salsuginibacillus halophilus]PSL40853.1 signal peptidase I [Salsuginibacillus halophilus]